MNKCVFTVVICFAFCIPAFSQDAGKDSTGIADVEKDSAAIPAAGPVKKGAASRKEKDLMARSLAPDSGMALLYVLRPSGFGALIKMSVLVDGKHIGATKAENYVYAMIEPGQHLLESHAENNSSMNITVEAGKIYYVRQQVKLGFAYAETGLKQLEDKDGQKDLKRCKLAKDNLATN